jgi:tRNA(Ile)-lysidine synthase
LLARLASRLDAERVEELCSGRVLIACSGGADSFALLALACHVGADVVVAHVDHGLRPGSSAEFAHVAAIAGRLGVPARSRAVTIEAGANLEARARELRYAALHECADDHGCAVIATGHTLDDQAETVLLALLRGAATRGLSGIAPRRGRIVRPILTVRRAETIELCRHLGWSVIDDPMNSDPAFTRVWLRREIIPALVARSDRDIAVVLARQAEVVGADDELLDALAADLWREAVVASGHTYEHFDSDTAEGASALRAAVLGGAPVALARRVLRRWIPHATDSATIDAVIAVARGEQVAVEVGHGRRVRRAANRLTLEPSGGDASARGRDSDPVLESVALSVPGVARFGGVTVRARVDHCPPLGWPRGDTVCVLDADRIGQDLVLRAPRRGERFRPIGTTGSKTVLGARAEVGIAVSVRSRLPVVASADGEILWVLGYRGADLARVDARTRRYCWLELVERAESPERSVPT